MDAVVLQDVWRGPRTVKPCGPDPPTLGSSLPMMNWQDDGGYQARYPEESAE